MKTTITFSFLLLAAGALQPLSAAENARIDPGHSSATFSVRHLVISTVRGVIPIIEGSVGTDGSAVPLAVSASLDAAKISSGNDDRDRDLRGKDWLETDKFPTITFKSTKIASGTEAGSFSLTGDLTIHGVTKSVTLNAKTLGSTLDGRGRKHTGYEATTTINRHDFGLNWANKTPGGGLVAGEDVSLTLDVETVGAPL